MERLSGLSEDQIEMKRIGQRQLYRLNLSENIQMGDDLGQRNSQYMLEALSLASGLDKVEQLSTCDTMSEQFKEALLNTLALIK